MFLRYLLANIFLVLFMCLAFNVVLNAQQNQLSLQQVIQLSVKNSKVLKASKARIEMTNAALVAAKNNQLPNFNISGSYLRVLNNNVELATKPAQTGGTPPASSPTINQAAYGIANISYPVYAGGKIKYGIESAQYLQQAATLDAENDKDAIALNAINAYINIYKANLTVNILKNNLSVARKRDSTFSRLEQNGLLPRNDLLKTELQTSTIELNLLEAQSNLELAAMNLNLMLGIKGNEIPKLDTSGIQKEEINSLEDYQLKAFRNRKDLTALSIRRKAIGTSIKSANADAYPTVALTGGYAALYIPKFITVTNAINAGIGVQYNLASLYKSNSKLAEAKARDQELAANQDLLSDAITYQVNQSYSTYALSEKKLEVFAKAITQAAENYRITKNKYDNSLVTLTELLEADVLNQQATLNYSLAKADAIAAYNKLLQSAGILKY